MNGIIEARHLPQSPASAAEVGRAMDIGGVGWNTMGCANWSGEYPYAPRAEFRIAWHSTDILLDYRVGERHVRAGAECDGGRVWEDSCCEFFCSPTDDGPYYNIECNCAGVLLVGAGHGRHLREAAPAEVLGGISRWASLGAGTFGTRQAPAQWRLSLVIPVGTFFRHKIGELSGRDFRANFYKCGDSLPEPHFMSWRPVDSPRPDFHRPESFGTVRFAQ